MKTFTSILFVLVCQILLSTCKTDELLKVTKLQTGNITEITYNSAKASAEFVDLSGNVSNYGHCWNTSGNPTITDFKNTVSGTAKKGEFTSSLTNLVANTKYYARAYAIDGGAPLYGNPVEFITNLNYPEAAIGLANLVTNTTATLNGTVNANGTNATVKFEYGFTNLYGSEINANPYSVTGNSITNINTSLSGLAPCEGYHFRVKATSNGETIYSPDGSFNTTQLPVGVTIEASNVSISTATLNGSVNATDLLTTVTFEYGFDTGYGSIVNGVPNSVSGHSNTSIIANISDLNPGTDYHFRVKAVNTSGISYGEDKYFTTECNVPTAITETPKVTFVGATLKGTVNANGCQTIVTFEYGKTTSYGSTTPETIVEGNSNSAVSIEISGLSINSSYHYRVKAVNSGGTVYGEDIKFTTGI
jgi:hypothetical protein